MRSSLRDPVYDLEVGQLPDGSVAMFAARQRGIAQSLDFGTTWVTVWNDSIATAIAVSPRFVQDGLVVAGVDRGILRSTDWGTTWHLHPLPGLQSLVSSLSIGVGPDSSYLIMVGTVEDGVYRSTDGGLTWIPSNTGAYISRIASVSAGPAPLCMIGTDGGMFLSTNNGMTWSDEAADQIDADVTSVAGDAGLFVMGTASDGIFVCYTDSKKWGRLRDSPCTEETIALEIIGRPAGIAEVVAVTSMQIQRYHLDSTSPAVSPHLVTATALPAQVTSAAIFTLENRLHALVASVDGDILLAPITRC